MPLKGVESSFYFTYSPPPQLTSLQYVIDATNIFPALLSIHIHSFSKFSSFILRRLSNCSLRITTRLDYYRSRPAV